MFDLRWEILSGYRELFIAGIWMTIRLTLVAIAAGLALGLVLGLISSSRQAPAPKALWARVLLKPASAGTGVIAGGPMRAVFESLGVADVVTKSVGTSNPYNMIRATFDALVNQTSPKSVAQRRGKKVADLLGRGGASAVEAEAEAAAITE